MIDRVEGFTEVGCSHDGAGRWFPLVETPGNFVGQRVKGCDGRVTGGKAMLVGRAVEVGKDKGSHKAFKNFRGRAEKRDGSVGNTVKGGFVRLKDREDKGSFPDSGEGSLGDREVKERSKIGNSKGA